MADALTITTVITAAITTGGPDWTACRALRQAIFVEEQGIDPADEFDSQDRRATHLLARLRGTPVGTLRYWVEDGVAHIGRVCVLRAARGAGVGAALMEAALDALAPNPTLRRITLSAQVQAMPFYTRLGFAPIGAPYMEDGIPHQRMDRAPG